MWAPIAIRRVLSISRAATVKATKAFDGDSIFSTSYPANNGSFNLIPVRFKTKSRKKKTVTTDDNDSESEDEGDVGANENPLLMNELSTNASDGSKQITLEVNSLRIDVVAKSVFNLTRLRAEESLLKGDIFINGEKPQKKSQDVRQGDEIDYIKGMNEEDPTMVDIKRAHIVEIPDKFDSHGRIKIKVSVYQDLTIKSPKSEMD